MGQDSHGILTFLCLHRAVFLVNSCITLSLIIFIHINIFPLLTNVGVIFAEFLTKALSHSFSYSLLYTPVSVLITVLTLIISCPLIIQIILLLFINDNLQYILNLSHILKLYTSLRTEFIVKPYVLNE